MAKNDLAMKPHRPKSSVVAALCGILLVGTGFLWPPSTFGTEATEAGKRAVVAYPDLAKEGSPINKKFLELYNREKARDSELLSNPDRPLLLAKEADLRLKEAAAPDSLKPSNEASLVPTKIKYTAEEPKDFDEYLEDQDIMKTVKYERVVPAKIFGPEGQEIPTEYPQGNESNPWRTLIGMEKAARARDFDALVALTDPELRKALAIKPPSEPASPHEWSMRVLAMMELDGQHVAFVHGRDKVVMPLMFIKRGDNYYCTGPRAVPEKTMYETLRSPCSYERIPRAS